MAVQFTPDELEMLTAKYRFTMEESSDEIYSIRALDFLDKDNNIAYFDKVASIYESTSEVVTASMFAKRYACLSIASGLYAMSMYNKSMDYSLENCHMESIFHGEAWLPCVRLTNSEVSQPEARSRNEWRDRVIQNIFADNVARVWDSFAKSVKISKSVLWENTAIYVYWLYENQFGEGASACQQAQLLEDYQYLVDEAPAHLFGESKNPLKKFNSPKKVTTASETPLRIRKTCCYYYQVADDNEYCPTCPKIKHEFVSV
ncbi:(2Fe-2S)-binding protein [Paenibacillus sp. SC116]|uniref:IucA/IucC family C-terminal-domain containing protein n=1 Tax=Paenibacillus sp. SC116 TaxID=2968986 RepID=UPI00215B5E0C|nr:IucA/IucC family C-terminal-domain containing protein [Paenibacillus sp. SC116]MCR8842088.1 (2Fe-2S)-binding protein [Paenibacillus sp. SC116]